MSKVREAALSLRLIDNVSSNAQKITSSLGGIDSYVKKFDRSIVKTRGQLFGAAGVAAAAAAAISMPIRAAVDFESAMADVSKVSTFSDEGLADYAKSLRHLATSEIPMAVGQLAALSAAAAQSGVADDELLDFTRLTAKAAVAWEMTGESAGDALAKIRTQLSLNNEQTASYADAINHLSDNTASSASDLVDYSKRVAAQGEVYGFAATDTLAFGASMISAGAQSEVAATSFRNMGRALTKGESATKRQASAYKALGLEAVKVSKAMQKDAVGTTLDVLERLTALPNHMQASVMSDLFGDEARGLAPLLNNLDLLRNALKMTANEQEYAGSVGKEFEKRANTTAYALERFRSQIREIGLSIGDTLLPSLNRMLKPLGEFAKQVAKWVAEHPRVVRSIVAVSGAFLGLRVAALAGKLGLLLIGREALIATRAIVGAGAAVGGFATAKMVAGLIAGRRALTGFIGAAAILGTRGAMGVALAATARGALALVNPLKLASAAMRGLALASAAARIALVSTGVGALLVAAGAALAFIVLNFKGMVAGAEAFGKAFVAALGPVEPMLRPVIDGISTVWGWLSELTAEIDPAHWQAWGTAAGSAVGGAVRSTVETTQAVIAAIAAMPGEIARFSSETYRAGANLMQNLWDGAVSKFNEFIEWVKGIPGRIRAAIGNIDLSGMIKWPSMPRIFGGSNTPSSDGIDGKRAQGGSVKRGLTYLVGEQGAETFTPTSNGYVGSNKILREAFAQRGEASSTSITNTGGKASINAPVNVTMHLNVTGASDDRLISVAQNAAKSIVYEITTGLDRELARSFDTAFSNLGYGDI